MVSKSSRRCEWNFAFKLEFSDGKVYELYSPNRKDRDKWVKIISIIVEMNK